MSIISNDPAVWLKSSYSGGQGGNCLEWAPGSVGFGVVPVRDSKDVRRAPLRFSAGAWGAFVGGLKNPER
ncbi:DUF397 domain-containing protein [Streptomyces sp. NRRL F-5053]|uniref:DUF397 domain-containing protein n=1 Tax=Streptomyces sp. NRRL F-5053 TaxID=1463854 RepID=UPI0004C871CE|nr:DUF397 domain-containing protein [Streptomyces sp. NRRL F-5053]